jgi:hypothetical protein
MQCFGRLRTSAEGDAARILGIGKHSPALCSFGPINGSSEELPSKCDFNRLLDYSPTIGDRT